MKRARAAALVLAAAAAVSAGCIFGVSSKRKATEAQSAPEPSRDARVKPAFQKRMLDELAARPAYAEAWGLFSEGGWSDAGQVLVFASADRQATRLLVFAPNRDEVAADRPLTAAEWARLAPHLERAAALADVNEDVFDALVYELVHARREPPAVVDRLFIKSAGVRPHPEHDALAEAFQSLRKP